jgi:hypothetical protein
MTPHRWSGFNSTAVEEALTMSLTLLDGRRKIRWRLAYAAPIGFDHPEFTLTLHTGPEDHPIVVYPYEVAVL